MSDNQSLYGLRWQRSLGGPSYVIPIREYFASAYQAAPGGTSVDMYAGDPVQRVSDGTIAINAAGSAAYGVCQSFGPVDYAAPLGGIAWLDHLPGGSTGTIGGEKAMFANVIPAASQVFEIDMNDNTTFTTVANYFTAIGENADIAYNADATAKKANPRLAITGHATTNTLCWRIVGLSQRINLDPSGLYYKLLVTANLVQQAPFQATGV